MIVRSSQLRYHLLRNRPLVIALGCVLLLFYIYSQSPPKGQQLLSTAENSTLGFGAIYVLTEDPTTWRVQGLKAAANLVGLRLTIPNQRRPDDDQISRHLQGDIPEYITDEIRTVLNYLSLLDAFVASNAETALFIEDDVDFGLPIKAQMRAIARTILAHDHPGDYSRAAGNEAIVHAAHHDHPYGTSSWDVLWIGHWGVEWTNRTEIWRYDDPHALPWERLTSGFNDYYERPVTQDMFPGAKRQQLIHNAAPVATYAFALTRAAAGRIVTEFRRDRVQKFDYGLHRLCKGLELECLAPVPEVMHHHKVEGQKSMNDAGVMGDGRHDLEWWRNRHKFTYNIEWSARCNAAGVGERIGDLWQCMPGKYDPST